MTKKYCIGVEYICEVDGYWDSDGYYIDRPTQHLYEDIWFDTLEEFFIEIGESKPYCIFIKFVKPVMACDNFDKDFPNINIYILHEYIEKALRSVLQLYEKKQDTLAIKNQIAVEQKRLVEKYYELNLLSLEQRYSNQLVEIAKDNQKLNEIIGGLLNV